MKMARASEQEWQNLMDFANEYEELTSQWGIQPSDEELGKLLKKFDPQFFRTIFGYQTLVDNVCDKTKDYLEFKPEIAKILETAGYQPTN